MAALGVVVFAASARARRRFGWLVLAVTAVATVSVPIAIATVPVLDGAVATSGAAHRGHHVVDARQA